MTAKEMTNALALAHIWDWVSTIIVPNVAYGLSIYEADLVVAFPSQWMEEVEIKVSMGDFRKEFVQNSKPDKHRNLQGIGHGGYRNDRKIRKYWIAMPLDLAEKVIGMGLVPEYAGVLAVPPNPRRNGNPVQILKDAPVLKDVRKLTDAEYQKLMRMAYIRYWNQRFKDTSPESVVDESESCDGLALEAPCS